MLDSGLSGCQLTPLSQGSGAVLFKDITATEVAVQVEMVVDRGVNSGEFLLGVQAVYSEPVSADFPVKQGKYREFSRLLPEPRRFAWSKLLDSLVLFIDFPKQHHREFSKPNREIFARSREFKIPAPWPVFPHGWLPKAVLFHKVGDHL